MECHGGVCGKCHAGKWIVFGIVLFIVTWWAKSRGDVYMIWYALAVLIALKGVMKLAMPNCPHCAVDVPKRGRR